MKKWGHNIRESLAIKYNLNLDDYSSYEEWRAACHYANEKLHGGFKTRYARNREIIKSRINDWRLRNKDRIKQQRQERYKGIDMFKGSSKNERFVGVVLKEHFSDSYIKQCHCVILTDQDRKDWDLTSEHIFVDYWVADMNLMVEYDGPHHYGVEMYYLRDKGFMDHTRKRDLFLNNYCKVNEIQLIRINGVTCKEPAQIRRSLEQSLLGAVSYTRQATP